MRSCKDISALVSESMERKLPLSRRIAIRMHLLMCNYCSRFERQLKFLRKAARLRDEEYHRQHECTDLCLTEEARARIKRRVEAERNS